MKYGAYLELDLGEKGKEYIDVMDKKINFKRSKLLVKYEKGKIIIKVDADDPTALVASLNSMLKQIRIIGNAEKIVDE